MNQNGSSDDVRCEMFQVITLVEPYFIGLALLCWELWTGWCLWTSIRSDMRVFEDGPLADADTATIIRAEANRSRPVSSRVTYHSTLNA